MNTDLLIKISTEEGKNSKYRFVTKQDVGEEFKRTMEFKKVVSDPKEEIKKARETIEKNKKVLEEQRRQIDEATGDLTN